MKKRISPNFAMRLSEEDKVELQDLAYLLRRSQTDTIRVLVREGRKVLPELKKLALAHPAKRSPGRQRQSAAAN